MDSKNTLLKLLSNKKSNVLRSEAMIALLKLHIYNNLKFLEELDMNLTVWDINIIVRTVQELKIKNINYQALINSNIDKISALGIMLAHLNKRKEHRMLIREKVGNRNEIVNEEAFLAYTTFSENFEDYDFLISKFDLASEKAQLYIIKSVVNSTDKIGIIHFLESIIKNGHFTLKVEALRTLLDLDVAAMKQFRDSEDKAIRQSYLQVLDINL